MTVRSLQLTVTGVYLIMYEYNFGDMISLKQNIQQKSVNCSLGLIHTVLLTLMKSASMSTPLAPTQAVLNFPVWLNTENNLFSRKQLFFGENKLI